MKGFGAFFMKELRELVRTKRLMLILGVFTVIGIMDPAIAKLTPKLYEMMAEDLKSQGITMGEIKVTAMDCWAQYVKNIPMGLIVLLIIFCGIYTSEYSKGTLIPLFTKGLSRSSVVLSKFAVMVLTWTAGSWLCFGVTYFYSGFYWDNSAVKNLLFSGFGWWLFGVLMISLIVFFSAFAYSPAQVMLGAGAVYFAMTLIGMYSKAGKYLPVSLTDSLSLYKGETVPDDCLAAAAITAALSLALVLAALPLTRDRKI